MKKVDLDVEERKETGNGKVGRLRKSGFVPGIVYGDNNKPLPVKLDRKKIVHFFHSIGEENVLTNLKIKSEGGVVDQLVIIKEMQHDPVTDELIHLDFQRVSLKKKIISEVRVLLKGEAEGVKAGGMLDQALRTIEVECLPENMPRNFEIDISGLKIHDSIHVKDLPLPPGVEMVTDGERGVLSILPPRKIEVEEVAPAAVTEPELVGKEVKEEVTEEGEKKEAEPQTEQKEKKEEPKGKAEEKKGK